MKRIIFLVICILMINFLSANEMIHKTLPNGMEIVVKENKLNESICFYCFVKTGSVNEGKYLGAGISHYLEHIVSCGTTTFRTEDEYEKMEKEMGALVNAYTSYVATAYYIAVEKQYKDEALKILSEQMQACVCDSFEVAREKQVILKEIVMRSTPPRSRIYQRNNELVYPNSNSKFPIIGYTELYKTITRDELEDYYKQRYAPNNMVFVAVGDFVAEEMLSQVEESFKNFPTKQLDPVYLPVQNPRLIIIIIYTVSFLVLCIIDNQSVVIGYFSADSCLWWFMCPPGNPVKITLIRDYIVFTYIMYIQCTLRFKRVHYRL